MRWITLLICTLITATGPVPAAQARSGGNDWDMVAFDMKYWGRPRWSWNVSASGKGSWMEAVSENGALFGKYVLTVHEVDAGEEGWRRLRAILERLPPRAPDYDKCRQRITDQPYGTLRLTRGSTTTEISWNAGCMDSDYKAFLDRLKQADTLVGEWGRSGRILQSTSAGGG